MLYDPTPQGGVIFYRVNPLLDGNANYNGDDILDEVYLFRRNNTSAANFNQIHNAFNPTTIPYPAISNGDAVEVSFANFSSYLASNPPEFMEFDYLYYVGLPEKEQFTSVYPNPASQILTIHADIASEKTVQVMDLSGRVVAEQKTADNQINMNISRLSAGCYFVKVTDADLNCFTTKFIKQ